MMRPHPQHPQIIPPYNVRQLNFRDRSFFIPCVWGADDFWEISHFSRKRRGNQSGDSKLTAN